MDCLVGTLAEVDFRRARARIAKVYMCYSILGLARYSAAGFQIGEFNTSITRSQLRVPPKYSIRIQRSTNVGLPPTDDANMCGERERLLSGKLGVHRCH